MAQNRQLQKIIDPKITRIRHRRRLLTTFPKFQARFPGLSNFLTREAARANLDVGITGVTEAEILAGLAGQYNDAGTVVTITRARHVRDAVTPADYQAQGIPIA